MANQQFCGIKDDDERREEEEKKEGKKTPPSISQPADLVCVIRPIEAKMCHERLRVGALVGIGGSQGWKSEERGREGC